MSIETFAKPNTVMTLKGGLYTLTAIQILDNDLTELSFQLDEKIKQAPNFFQHAPMILDLQPLTKNGQTLDFESLIVLLKSKNLIPIGVRGLLPNAKSLAIEAGLAVFPDDKPSKKEAEAESSSNESAVKQENIPPLGSRVITQPVRSGQQIYAPGGDLIVLSSVSHGAEILADGHIHVYGALRGRALAGVMGNRDAMIICKSLEAELVSIAGQYRLSEDLKAIGWKQSVCVQLKENRLNIVPV